MEVVFKVKNNNKTGIIILICVVVFIVGGLIVTGLLFDNVNNSIISTGGGFYKTPNLERLGTIIYLKAEFDYIIQRINKSPNASKKLAKRPLLSNLDEARKLHSQRDDKYTKKADYIVNVENKTPKDIAKEIKKLIK